MKDYIELHKADMEAEENNENRRKLCKYL